MCDFEIRLAFNPDTLAVSIRLEEARRLLREHPGVFWVMPGGAGEEQYTFLVAMNSRLHVIGRIAAVIESTVWESVTTWSLMCRAGNGGS